MFRKISYTIVALAGLAGAATPAAADGLAVGAQVGTLGLGVNVAKEVNSFLALRVNANAGQFTMPSMGLYDTSFGGISYDVEGDLKNVGLLADFHPLGLSPIGDGFVVTGGLYYNKNEFSASTGPITATVGSTSYSVDLLGTISFDEFAPYLGVGYDGTFHSILPVAFFARAGVLFQGSPSVTLRDIDGTVLLGQQAELDAEAAQIEADLANYEYYPVLTVGLSISF